MNRDQKAAAIAEIATYIEQSEAVFAVDYKGISVPQAAELRAKLRDADATFKVVKNSLTERAADQAGIEALKALLEGPTALTFVRGDAATAAKAIADYGRTTQLLPFKGGFMDGSPLDPEQIRALSRLPSREVLYGQLVGVVASPVSGLVRMLNALIAGLAVALGQVNEKKQSGEIPAGEPPAAATTEQTATASEGAATADAGEAQDAQSAQSADASGDASTSPEGASTETDEPAGGAEDAAGQTQESGSEPSESVGEAEEPGGEAEESAGQADEPAGEAEESAGNADDASAKTAEPDSSAESAAEAAGSEPSPGDESAGDENREADASEPEQPETAEAKPTKED